MENVKFPEWFKSEAGFKFLDSDRDLVVVLGNGSWRACNPMGGLELYPSKDNVGKISKVLFGLELKPEGIIAAYLYKNEWHFRDLNYCDEYFWIHSSPFGMELTKPKVKKYQVFDNDRPADHSGYNEVSKSWNTSIFDSLDKAREYAIEWLGIYDSPKTADELILNGKYYYRGGYIIIKEILE